MVAAAVAVVVVAAAAVAAAAERGIMRSVRTPQVEAVAALVKAETLVAKIVVFWTLMNTVSQNAGKNKYEYIST